MAPGKYISGYLLGNITTKRCVNRSGSMSGRSNNSNKETSSGRFQTDTKPAGRKSIKKIRSHVFYSKKHSYQKLSGCTTEKPVAKFKTPRTKTPRTKTPRSNSSSRNQLRIKSSSWKRSDKRGNYGKAWRKKSPNWITLQPAKQTLKPPVQSISSECRPGTLYSDVVFRGKIALPNPPVILFKKDDFNFCTDLPTNKYANFEIAENLNSSSTKINELKKRSNNEKVDEAFPPLLASNLVTPKNSNKYKNNMKIKPTKSSINCDLNTDELIFNVNSSNESNVMGDKNNIENEDLKALQKEDSLTKYNSNELIKTSNSGEVEDLNCSKNFCPRSEGINELAYGLYLKGQNRQNSDKTSDPLNVPTEKIKKSDEEVEFKYKYLPIINVKLFDNFDEEYGYGYSGFNQPRRSYLSIERGDQTFPRFSRHFHDAHYIELEDRAIANLEAALRKSSI